MQIDTIRDIPNSIDNNTPDINDGCVISLNYIIISTEAEVKSNSDVSSTFASLRGIPASVYSDGDNHEASCSLGGTGSFFVV